MVITHAHPDHFFGTEVFLEDNPKIIGHEKLNRSMYSNYKFYKELQFNSTKDNSLKETKLVTATVEIKINNIHKIDLGERIIEVRAWESGHTDNDLSVFDTKTKVFWSEELYFLIACILSDSVYTALYVQFVSEAAETVRIPKAILYKS